jgi:regulator of sigma D
MGCLSSFGMPNTQTIIRYNDESMAIARSKDELLMKLYEQKIYQNGTEELLKIIEENKKLYPLLKTKIEELIEK